MGEIPNICKFFKTDGSCELGIGNCLTDDCPSYTPIEGVEGEVPWTAEEALELLHSKIARTPAELAQLLVLKAKQREENDASLRKEG